MKKFYFFIASLFIAIGAMAQTATIEASTTVETPENVYTIKNGQDYYMTAYTSPTSINPARFAFYAVDGIENAYYIYSVDREEWVSYTKEDSYSNKTNFATFATTKDDANYWNATIVQYNSVNYYQFAPYKTEGVANIYLNWLHGIGTNNPLDNTTTTIGVYGTGGASDSGSRWTLEKASDLADETEISATKSLVKTTVGYPATTTAAYNAIQALTVGTSTKMSVELAKNAYLAETDIILPEDGKAYTIANKAYDGTPRYITYTKGSKPTVSTTSSDGSVFICKKLTNNVYAFITSDGNILTWIGNNEGNAYNENGVYGYSTYYATSFNNYNDWNNITLVKQNATTTEAELGTICMQARRAGSSSSSFIVKTTDNRFDQAGTTHFFNATFSSAFIFTEVEHVNSDAQNTAIAKINVKTNNKPVSDEVGLYHFNINGEKVTDYTSLDAATTVNDVNTIASTLEVNVPATGKFYRLKNAVNNRYMSANESSITVIDNGGDAASTIFYLGDNNTLLSYTQGRYLDCNAKNLAAVGTSYNGLFAAAYGTPAANVITYKNNGYWTYGNRNNDASIDRGSSDPNQNGYNWVIEEVTELPVAVSAAGVATFYTPVALTIPANVECYYIKEAIDDKGIVQLTAIENVVPAGNGIVIKAGEGTHNFTIGGEASEITDNLLEGTSAATYISKEAYVLANGENGVGLYKAALSDGAFLNNANKAYFAPTTADGIASYSFNFDWAGTTGIEGVEAEGTQNGKIYDITGREVKAITAPGIYIVNGRKVVK